MARRHKQRPDSEAQEPKPKPPPKVATQLGALLKEAGVKPGDPRKLLPQGPRTLPPPSPEPAMRVPVRPASIMPVPVDVQTKLSGSELRALNDAYAGVRKLSQKSMPYREVVAPTQHVERKQQAKSDELQARARLDALVAGGVRFKLRRDDDFVEALRQGVSPKLLARVTARRFSAEATLDLHGKREGEVGTLVTSFVRTQHKKGARQLLIITGKGLHSEGGVSVLREAVINALTTGAAAPLLSAFATAHGEHGGSGALCLLLDA